MMQKLIYKKLSQDDEELEKIEQNQNKLTVNFQKKK